MGSGVILLVIVAAWLAVLVPMALRSHDSADSLSSVERFSDAMRVLARRDPAARARARAVAGPERLGEDPGHDPDDELDGGLDHDPLGEWEERRTVADRVRRLVTVVRSRPARTPAERRRRLLLALLAGAVVTLAGGLLLTRALLAVHAVVDLALVLYVVALRRMTLRRRQGMARQVQPHLPAPVPAARHAPDSGHRLPIARPSLDREPATRVAGDAGWGSVAGPLPAPVPTAVLVQPALRSAAFFDQDAADEPLLADGAAAADRSDWPVAVDVPPVRADRRGEARRTSTGLGAPWTPVPVPPPLYAGKAVAPRLRERADPVPASRTPAHGAMPPGSEPAPARREDPRRAVNDW